MHLTLPWDWPALLLEEGFQQVVQQVQVLSQAARLTGPSNCVLLTACVVAGTQHLSAPVLPALSPGCHRWPPPVCHLSSGHRGHQDAHSAAQEVSNSLPLSGRLPALECRASWELITMQQQL